MGRIFNHRRPKRYPVAVIEATTECDIVGAVKLAIEKQCRISVRSGGHSWAAWSVRDDAILLDLGKYKEVDLDQSAGIVRVFPSITGRALNGHLRQYGLGCSVGDTAHLWELVAFCSRVVWVGIVELGDGRVRRSERLML